MTEPQTTSPSKSSNSSPVIELLKRYQLPLLVMFHAIVFALVSYASLVVRFETWFPSHAPNHLLIGVPLMACVQSVVFYFMKNFHGWWRYVTFADLVSTAQSAVIATVLIFAIDYLVISGFQVSRGAILINCAFTILVLSAIRSVLRFWDERSPVS